jgi:hypothetical protein
VDGDPLFPPPAGTPAFATGFSRRDALDRARIADDGRRRWRCRRRCIVERTIGWLHGDRRVLVRHECWGFLYRGFVQLACTLIALTLL